MIEINSEVNKSLKWPITGTVTLLTEFLYNNMTCTLMDYKLGAFQISFQ